MHLMKTSAPDPTITFPIAGNDTVENVTFVESSQSPTGRLFINKDQHFEGIPTDVWNFYVGGYQVLDKWLKSRTGRKLSYEDMDHFKKIVAVLKFTIRQMTKIDEVWQEVMS